MPILDLVFNTQIDNPKEVILELSQLGAKLFQKPESYMLVFVTYNENLVFGGTFKPAFFLRIDCLDQINPTLNKEYSLEFSRYIEEKLKIPKDRGYIAFCDPGRAYVGYNGTTFETILGGK